MAHAFNSSTREAEAGRFLCNPDCPGTHSVDQAGLELRDPPASASQVLGLKVCVTAAWRISGFDLKLFNLFVKSQSP